AQCHDHKFDPIPTKDYYSLLGVFRSTELADLPVAPAQVVAAYDEQKKRVDVAETKLKEFAQSQANALASILALKTARYLAGAWQVLGAHRDVQTVSDEERLDRETFDRWLDYLRKPEKEHPFLKWWEQALGPAASLDEVRRQAETVQAAALAVEA